MIMSTLRMLKIMQGVGAHHVDIKEANLLYNIECPSKRSLRTAGDVRAAVLNRSGAGCSVQFVLSDFGLVMFNGDPDHEGGTPGMIGPSRLYDKDMGKEVFTHYYQLPRSAGITAASVWASYNAVMRKKRTLYQRFEKSDLYALGVMLFTFDLTDTRLDVLRKYAVALIMGRSADIWDIDTSLKRYRELRKTYQWKGGSNILLSIREDE
jgi:serine/threonine protein kinase